VGEAGGPACWPPYRRGYGHRSPGWPRERVGRLLARTTVALVRVQIFDRAMTLAAQIFTSVFPLLILVGTLAGGATARRLADWAGLRRVPGTCWTTR
jgi:hypothetical protein